MTIASGIEKLVVLAIQTAQGTVAEAALATAQYLRRVTSTIDLAKETYQSNEIRPSRQVSDYRHGVESIDGTLNGELSPETYELLMAAILRKDFVAGVADAANTGVASDASGTLTRDDALGSWLEDGFKIGDVVRCSGFTATANNDINLMITVLTDTVMTVIALNGSLLTTESKGQAVTTTVQGMKTWTPVSGHTENWFTIEHNFPDVDLSEVFYDLKPNTMAISLPATGMATIDIGLMGLNHNFLDSAASPYFSSVVAATSNGIVAAVNGVIAVEGTQVALITGIDFDIAANLTNEPVVGSNIKPDLFEGKVVVTGNMSVFFQDATFRDYFENETEVSVACSFTTSDDDDADFLSFSMPRVKMGGSTKDDGEKGIIQTMPFVALFDTNAGADTGATATDTLATTLSIQDSTLS